MPWHGRLRRALPCALARRSWVQVGLLMEPQMALQMALQKSAQKLVLGSVPYQALWLARGHAWAPHSLVRSARPARMLHRSLHF